MRNKRLYIIWLALLPMVAQAQDLSLRECLDLGAQNSHSIVVAQYGSQAAQAQQAEARWEYFPRVQLASYGYQSIHPILKVTVKDILGNSDQANVLNERINAYAHENGIKPYYSSFQHGFGAGVTALQPVYAGGRIRNGNVLADLGVDASEIQKRITGRAVRDSVENKYWRIVALQEKEKTLDRADALLAEIEKELSGAVAAGVATETDLMTVRMKQREMAAGRYRLQGSMSLLKMDLFNDIGYSYRYADLPGIRLSDRLDALEPPAFWVDGAAEAAPSDESRLLSLNVQAQQLQKKMATGELLPQVSLGASYGYNALMEPRNGNFNGFVFATMRIPLTDLGKASARARRYDAQIQQARADRDYLEARLDLQLQMLRHEMETCWKELEVARDVVDIAEKTFAQMQTSVRSGRSMLTDLLQAEVELVQAHEDLLGREIAYREAVNAYCNRLASNGRL